MLFAYIISITTFKKMSDDGVHRRICKISTNGLKDRERNRKWKGLVCSADKWLYDYLNLV